MRLYLIKNLTYVILMLSYILASPHCHANTSLDKSTISFPVLTSKKLLEAADHVFKLTEIDYEPKYKIEYISSRTESKSNNVENTFISRFSAIAAQDINWWKEEWALEDEADKSLEMLSVSANGIDKLMNRWKNISTYYDIFLVKKIIYKTHVIIMYELTLKNQSSKGLVLPIVLKTMGNKGWKITSDLRKSLLFKYMPWKSKNYLVVEKDALWVLEE